MPHATEASESPHVKCTRPRTQFAHLISLTDPNPQIPSLPQSARRKPTISSILSAPSHDTSGETARPGLRAIKKKANFSAATFRGFGCTAGASQQVSLPAVIRTSADWQQNRARKKKHKRNGANNTGGQGVLDGSNPGSVGCVDFQDVWCGPGIGLSADVAAPADSVVVRKNGPTRGKADLEKMTHSHRERFTSRPESFAFATAGSSYRHVPLPLPSSQNFAGMMLLQGNLLMGGRLNSRDHFRDWRLDVDNMTYEQLLELGERIGYVNTGLKEDEIGRYIRRFKLSKFNETSKRQVDNKCSICQEEYEAEDEVGRLSCGHDYHFQCLRQWLAQKNCCPVCKQEVVSRHSLAKS